MDELLNQFHYELAGCRNRKDYKNLEIKYLEKVKQLPLREQQEAIDEIKSTIEYSK